MKIGIDLGGSHIAIGVIESNGTIVEKVEKNLKEIEKKKIKNIIEETIAQKVKELTKKYSITEVGIAIPGTVTKDTIVKSVNLGLENEPIVERLKKEINLPIQIRNDAKCAAIAEDTYGVLKPYNRSLFLTLGTGIGGAVIIEHKLLDTGELPGCEFGHISIHKEGKLCHCGRKGCLERYASMKALKDNLRQALGVDDRVSGRELLEVINNHKKENENYEIIEKVISEWIQDLASGIANLINIFEPEVIGIGGSFAFFEEVLLERLKKELKKENVLFNPRKEINIKTAILENDAGIIGAIL